MYLREMRVVNDGPIADVTVNVEDIDGLPKPLIFVGANGTGKTNILSLIADAIVEGASQHHSDVVAPSGGVDRHWFRIVGGATLRRGAPGGFALLRFEEGGTSYVYTQKAGEFPPASVPPDLSPALRPHANWSDAESVKLFPLGEDASRRIYQEGCYAYFPASRSELPHWMNSESLRENDFNVEARYSGRLGRPLYIDRGIERLQRWIPRVLIDSRPEFQLQVDPAGQLGWHPQTNSFPEHYATRVLIEEILRIILDDPRATLTWQTRFAGLQYHSPRLGPALSLSSLSSGQATLLSIFGTVLMQSDISTSGKARDARGICVVDEIDAHVHVDLAFRAIPQLIRLFPRVQFVTSAHSPLYILGMQAEFGDEGVQILELPTGRTISSEGFSEFTNAMKVLEATRGFDDLVAGRVRQAHDPLVLCEGETDPRYIRAAASALGRESVLDGITLDWIGTRDATSGGSTGAGKDNLSRAWKLLTANPELVLRPTLLLYDNDTKAPQVQMAGRPNGVYARNVPTNPSNSEILYGIENLLDPVVFTKEMFTETARNDGNGKRTVVTELSKVKLCSRMCEEAANAQYFTAFSPLLDILAEWRVEIGLDAAPIGPIAAEERLAEMGPEAAGTDDPEQALTATEG